MSEVIKTEEKPKNQMGRPPKPIDWKFVDSALQAGCSGVEIAAYLGVHSDTLYDAVAREFGETFTTYSLEKSLKGKSMLRLAQFQEAVHKRDRGMLIWLGKQRLDQKDSYDTKVQHSGLPNIPVVNFGDIPNPKPYQTETPNTPDQKKSDQIVDSAPQH